MKATKTLLLLITGAVMLVFLIGALQTIEYCVNNFRPIPWQVWCFFAAALAWCVIATRVPRSEWRKVDSLLRRLLNE